MLNHFMTENPHQRPDQLSMHCKVMATFYQKATVAKPTPFHYFMRALQDRGTLLRIYTQNIDFLELKAGISMYPDLDHPQIPPKCIPLHGTLEHLRCHHCSSLYAFGAYYSVLEGGELPECGNCRTRNQKRLQDGKRQSHKVPGVYPNIILYGQPHPQEDEIADVQSQDLGMAKGSGGQADFLLVVGTSLKIKGVVEFIRRFSKMKSKNNTSRNLDSGALRTIYLNDTFPQSAAWNGVFDAWINSDCQEFARLGLEAMEGKVVKLQDEVNLYPKQRLDSRPSWRWWAD